MVWVRDSRCDRCNKQQDTLHVDHCHSTGKIRGLLCSNCNRGIGLLGDTLDDLRSAVRYLEMAGV